VDDRVRIKVFISFIVCVWFVFDSVPEKTDLLTVWTIFVRLVCHERLIVRRSLSQLKLKRYSCG